MLQLLKNLLRPPEAKASRTARLVALESGGRPRWTPRDYAALAREGFVQNAIVHRAVKLIAENAAAVPLLVYENDTPRDRHPLTDLLARPNPRQDGAGFLEAVTAHLLIAGNSYVEAVALDGAVRELYALRPDRMRVVPGPDGWAQAYEYTVGGQTVRFEQSASPPPILHLTLFNPLDDHYGLAPLEAAAVAIDTHNAAAGWNKALLDNSARPCGALVYAGPDGAVLSDAQYERLKRELQGTYQGAANAGRPLLLEGGLDWKSMSLTPKDMDFLEAKHTAAREIALAFGVPPMLLGIPGDNTYANYQEANRVFWRATVLPLAERIAHALAQWLAPAFGKEISLVADTDRIEALSADRAALWERVGRADFLTLNEKRQMTGFGPVDGGDGFGAIDARAPDSRVSDSRKAGFNPDQPRWSAGSGIISGRWSGGSDGQGTGEGATSTSTEAEWTTEEDEGYPFQLAQLGGVVNDADGTPYYQSGGHHEVPKAIYEKWNLTPDTRKVFERATTGTVPGMSLRTTPDGVPQGHFWDGPSGAHRNYNDAVKELSDRYLEQNNIRPDQMTPEHALELLREIRESQDPRIRNYNSTIRLLRRLFRLRTGRE